MTAQDYVPAAQHIQLAPTLKGATRPDLPRTGGERETLTAFLDRHRETFALECAAIAAAAPSLDTTCRSLVTGKEMSLRFILVDLIAEYARRNGHADLLRERLDGTTGA
jgi:hypothetical protein